LVSEVRDLGWVSTRMSRFIEYQELFTYKVAEEKIIVEGKTSIIESKDVVAFLRETDHCLSK